MRVAGKFINNDTLKPVPGVVVDVFATGMVSGSPMESLQANDDGTFSFSSSVMDSGESTIQVQPFGYHQMIGSPGILNGDVLLYPTEVTKVVSSIPWWAWVAVVIVILGFINFKYKKLF